MSRAVRSATGSVASSIIPASRRGSPWVRGPGKLRQCVISDGIIRMLMNVPSQLLQTFVQPDYRVTIDAGAVAANRIIGLDLQILVVGQSGVTVVTGVLCCPRECQQNV